MPIKPENRKLYPANWSDIREMIIRDANNRCDKCGLPNGSIGYREDGRFYHVCEGTAEAMAMEGEKVTKIVLTVAHLDHDPTNNDRSNLRALCQKCHFAHDRADNMSKAIETRRKNRADRELF
jgi:5-methylcytosine-specific restriction endonuclease McrA